MREADGVRARPFACGFTVLATTRGHERMLGARPDDEQISGPQRAAHGSGNAPLRRLEQRFDVGAYGIELLALVNEVAV
jgi:hypothetical protein